MDQPEPTTAAPTAPEVTTVEVTTVAIEEPVDAAEDPVDAADPVDDSANDEITVSCFAPTVAECVAADSARVVSEVYNENTPGGRKTELTAEATIALGSNDHTDWTILVNFNQRVQNFNSDFDSKQG